jgi:hydroxyacylglutathione hydrolase
MSTIGYELRFNPAIRAATSAEGFVDFILSGQPEPPLYFATMKRVNKVGPTVLGKLPAPPRIGVDELGTLDPRAVAIIDTRAWDAFRLHHLPGSLFFPLNKSFNTDAGSMVNADVDIYLIVAPDRLDEAVRDLVRVGLDRLRGWCPAAELNVWGDERPVATLREVSVAEATALLERRAANVLDVRRATEFAEAHIPGATNIAHTRLAARLAEVPKDKPLLVNCLSGGRSARACALLQRAGWDVMNLQGGMQAWKQQQGRVVAG